MAIGPSCMPNEIRDPRRQLLVLGPPGTRRIDLLLAGAGAAGWHDVRALSYPQALRLASAPAEHRDLPATPLCGALVRLDSPQDDVATARCILKLGIVPTAAAGRTPLATDEIERLTPARGELLHPLQWYLGLREMLEQLARNWDGQVRWMSHPHAVSLMFDKAACRRLWQEAGLPVAPSPARSGSYDALRAQVGRRHARLFIKLRYGYAAAGAVALEWHGGRVRAITTVETAGDAGRTRIFVSRRPRVLLKESEIAYHIDTLAEYELVVEEWLPKARWQGRAFDVRAVMVRGRLEHAVGRAASSPFTNLNLGARRIPREILMRHVREWDGFVALCEAAAACFPNAGSLGLDILVLPCRRRMVLLEANAFGDYLPGLLHAGATTYEAALRAWRDL